MLFDALVAVLLAPLCESCGRVLERPLARALCDDCWAAIPALVPPLCVACSDALPSWRVADIDGGLCPRCRRVPDRAVARLVAAGPYEGTLRDAVHAFKYRQRRSLAGPLARLMARAGRDLLAGADAVVPVPLHPRRRHQRGFNQAALLARGLGLPAWDVLRRTRPTAPQVALPRASRHRNVRGAFRIGGLPMPELASAWLRRDSDAGRVAGRVLVLVDDVTTTGATLEACGRVLREAGAREVRALTAARAVTRLVSD
ncbi:MAG: ComF family protein [Vicinamibacterales bacterium]